MAEKQISNAPQAFSLGANWGTPSVDNAMTTEQANLINQTGQVLYTGDVVSLDATGTSAILPATGSLTNVLGCVGGQLQLSAYPAVENIAGANVNNTFPTIVGAAGGTGIGAITTDGNVQPFADPAWQSLSLGFTNGSTTVTYGAASANFVGQYIYTPYNASTNANPQVFQIVSFVANTSFGTVVISGAGTTFSGTTGSFTCQVGRDTDTKGPGWQNPLGWTNASAFGPGVVVPVIIRGFGRVNISTLSTMVLGDGVGGTNASVIGTRFAYAATGYASATGLIIAVALEAYAQRDTTLTSIGIANHESIRALIGKM